MDISIIQKQYEQPTEYPSSIALQNHIYGCFILMEDIAQGTITYDGTLIKTLSKDGAQYVFPIDQAFTQIGIRYGFLFDTKLILEDCLNEYKTMWLSIFKILSVSKKIEEVDAIEDSVIAWIQKTIVAEDAYFIHALETGILPQLWIGKVVGLLLPALSQALSEKPVVKQPVIESVVEPPVVPSAKSRQFARTRRNHATQPSLKKNFAHTRRSGNAHSAHSAHYTNTANTIIHIQ